ncbi:hypothetical protein [Streptomyces sp. NPDC031705]|uniref:WXG100 family type VII secretion target n=1 Tax=Streptomyces sp. NPDC031705 TaxID=3155729 RepID=UPI0033D57F25
MATTNFEGYSHEQLLAMIASLDPETVKARGTQLTQAAAAIKDIGESLKKHQVKGWEGEAARAFQEWVSRAGSATLLLSQYSEAGGKWMTEAAQTMVEVKANTPKYDTAAAQNLESARKYHNDPDAQQLGQTAHTKLTTDHAHAVQQLTKLAQSYEQSTTQMTTTPAPTFPPPPGVFEPAGYGTETVRERPEGSSGAGGGMTAGQSYALPSGGGGPSYGSGQPSIDQAAPNPGGAFLAEQTVPPTHVTSGRDVGVGLDQVAMLPEKTLPLTPGLPGGPGPSVPAGGWNPPLGPLPPLTLPPIGGPPVHGGGPLPGKQPPSAIGGKGVMPPLPPRDTGIVGGRPLPINGPSTGVPRGTVIGAEGGHPVGRGMMGGGFNGPHAAPGSPAAGRRLAVEPGGVVGGRAVGAGGQPFTHGGSGLVRNGPGLGAGGAGAHAPGRGRGDQGGSRPDYLAEDEETWQGNRRVVPPVID